MQAGAVLVLVLDYVVHHLEGRIAGPPLDAKFTMARLLCKNREFEYNLYSYEAPYSGVTHSIIIWRVPN